MELLAEMQQKGLAPNAITYSAAIGACEKAKQSHKAMELRAVMQQKGLALHAIIYGEATGYVEGQAASRGDMGPW